VGKTIVKATPSAYSMQKQAYTLYTALAMELADYNIRVNAVSPAVVNTTLYHGVLAEKKQRRHLMKTSNR
jgi:NAD(P)-dependent dehydrogenase (short-subunit alcohol dehydrogenase family)